MSAPAIGSMLLPLVGALVCIVSSRTLRRWACRVTGLGLLALVLTVWFSRPFGGIETGPSLHTAIHAAGLVLLAGVAVLAYWLRSLLGFFFTAAQLVLLVWMELFLVHEATAPPALAGDGLSLLMAVIVNGVGGLILLYTAAYMDPYLKEHPGATEGRFYVFLTVFLGAMNGLVFSNDLRWFLFFWEVTTVCSFALIATDRTPEAVENALRALWMTMLGGMIVLFLETEILSMAELVQTQASGPAPAVSSSRPWAMSPCSSWCSPASSKRRGAFMWKKFDIHREPSSRPFIRFPRETSPSVATATDSRAIRRPSTTFRWASRWTTERSPLAERILRRLKTRLENGAYMGCVSGLHTGPAPCTRGVAAVHWAGGFTVSIHEERTRPCDIGAFWAG